MTMSDCESNPADEEGSNENELVWQSLMNRHLEDGERDKEFRWRCDWSSAEKGKTSGLISKRDCENTIAEKEH